MTDTPVPYAGDSVEEQMKHIPAEDWSAAMRFREACDRLARSMSLAGLAREVFGVSNDPALRRAGVLLERMVRSGLVEPTDVPSLYRVKRAKGL